jgi:hypothetical protein
MPSYLERYRRGEHEQVWAELLALGGRVREKPLHADALAVAHETMTRARANIELLAPRLTTLGYQFAHADRVFVPADGDFRRFVDGVERRAGPLPLSLRAWIDVVGEVNFMGAHPKLGAYVPPHDMRKFAHGFLMSFAGHGGSPPAGGDPVRQSYELTQRLLNDVVQRIRSGQPQSPEALAGARASKEALEQLQRPGPAPAGPDVDSDPLVVEPYFGDLEDDLANGGDDEDETVTDASDPYSVIIAPDPVHKTGHSGGSPYSIDFPNTAVDARLEGEEDYGTFVEYLRVCFRWGGFPGLRASATPPREELAFLTQGLAAL